jgi:hypothetical protein
VTSTEAGFLEHMEIQYRVDDTEIQLQTLKTQRPSRYPVEIGL